jgi:hypothetical protein
MVNCQGKQGRFFLSGFIKKNTLALDSVISPRTLK